MDKTSSQAIGNEVLSEEVYQYAKEFPQGRPVTEALSAILSRFLGPYQVEARAIRDVSGRVAPAFDVVAYLQPPEPDGIVIFDSVATAIDSRCSEDAFDGSSVFLVLGLDVGADNP